MPIIFWEIGFEPERSDLMFRPMRRAKQELSRAVCEEILHEATSGVLAVSGDDGYPYAVPLSYVYTGGKVYFHCATTGHKLDAIAANPKVSFCVIQQDEVVPERFTTHYRSVILFGTARVLTDPSEKMRALEALSDRYCPGDIVGRTREIEDGFRHLHMVELTVDHMSGKESRELAEERRVQE